MLLSTRKFLTLPAGSGLLPVAAGLVTLQSPVAPGIQVLAVPEPLRNARLTLLDAFAEVAPTAVGAVALESASLIIGVGGIFWNVGAAFGAVTALADLTGIRVQTPVFWDIEELLQAGLNAVGLGVTAFWQVSLNNTGAATTAAIARSLMRWQYDQFDSKGEG